MRRRCYVLLTRYHNVSIRRHGNVRLRPLGSVLPRRRWVFHLRHTSDVTGRQKETLLRRRNDVLLLGK